MSKSHFKNSTIARGIVRTEKSVARNFSRQKKREVAVGRLALCVYADIYAVDGSRAARVGDTYPQQGALYFQG
jgi:hypothetical protein